MKLRWSRSYQWLRSAQPFLFLFLLVTGLAAQSRPAADLIITNAKVWTVDKARPQAQAVAIIGERVVAVGSNQEIAAWRGPKTKVLDAGGKLVMPGFNDAHVHLVDGGRTLENVNLRYAKSPEEFARILGEREDEPTRAEVLAELDWVMDRAVEHLGPQRAGRYLRKFYPWYVERLGEGKRLQEALQRTTTVQEAREILALQPV